MLFESTGESPETQRAMTEAGLPELTGQSSEVSRAHDIRTKILMEADDVLSRLRSDEIITESQSDTDIVSPRQVTDDQVHAAQMALNRIRHQSEAAWWIAHENETAAQILTRLMASPFDQP